MGLNVSCPALGFFLLGTGEKRAEKEGRPPPTPFSQQAATRQCWPGPQLPLPCGATAGPGPGMAA